MVTVLTDGRFSIRVYSHDHKPVHCHVIWEDNEVIVELPSYKATIRKGSKSVKTSDVKKICELIKKNRNIIGKQWRVFHGN